MTITSHEPPAPAPDTLRFACHCCGGALEVPASLAGVSGPCPLCGETTVAPSLETAGPVPGAARLFAKPPPRRELPPPLAPVSDYHAASPARQTTPAAEDLLAMPSPHTTGVPATAFPVSPSPWPAVEEKQDWSGLGETVAAPVTADTSPLLLPIPVPVESPLPRWQLEDTPARGIFGEPIDSRAHVLDIRPNIPMSRRHGWRRWFDIGIVSVFTGLLLATAAALRYTVPLEDKAAASLPANLTQLVERETQYQSLRGHEAGELACAAVNRYLGAASEQAAASHLLPPPEGMAPAPFPPFPTPPSEWTVASTRRIPLTERYLAVIQPKDADRPVFVVEQTESGPRLHAGPITQQSAQLFEKFIATPGQGEATLYVEMRPTVPGHERDYRSGRPDLDSFTFVDLQPGFPGDAKPFIACLKPDSEAARQFARRGAHDLNWRRALVQVRWQIHREAGPWVELVRIMSSPWSGDPPPVSSPATTASTSVR
jgi:hypothetical protein